MRSWTSSWVTLDRDYLDHQCDAFKIDNTLVYQILLKVFTYMDVFVYVKQRKETQDGWAVFFDVHKHFLGSEHVARQAAEAEEKLQTSHYDGERKTWDWNKYLALHK